MRHCFNVWVMEPPSKRYRDNYDKINWRDRMLKRVRVKSSNIASVGYSPGKESMEVEFVGRHQIYRYYSVPLETYKNLMSAPSIGEFFHKNIRGKFGYVKFREANA